MQRNTARSLWVGLAGIVAIVCSLLSLLSTAQSQNPSELAALAARAQALERDVGLLEDQNAVKKLQRIYGFYTDKQTLE